MRQSTHTKIILGPPGTGKTTRLISLLKEELSSGIDPRQIAYISFTNAAIDEALGRVLVEFPEYMKRDFPYFKTVHSLCYKARGFNSKQVMNRKDYQDVCNRCGLEYKGFVDFSEGYFNQAQAGDRALHCIGLANARQWELERQYNQHDEDFSLAEVIRLNNYLERYKDDNHKVDFNDMLVLAANGGLPTPKVVFIDEAQDMSKLQWIVAKKLISTAERAYVAGDDDQAIYSWAGADVDSFIELDGQDEILSKSHRVPRLVHQMASRISGNISYRKDKPYSPAGQDGEVHYISSLEELDLGRGSWLVLARNNYLLVEARALLEEAGYPYDGKDGPLATDQGKAIIAYEKARRGQEIYGRESKLVKKYGGNVGPSNVKWQDALPGIGLRTKRYIAACNKRGESIIEKPRISVSTIHGAKGAEADNVVLFSDMSRASYNEITNDPNNELRVQYVGVTRARQKLFVVLPTTQYYFEL